MIPQEDRDETPGAQRKVPRMGATRTPLHLVFQACVGVIIGIGVVSLLSGLAPAQVALTGVVIAILVWIVEQGFRLPEPNTKQGARVRMVLRLISLIGFTIAVSPLLSLIEG
ncbi:putative membrane protein [Arthrobacter sp. JUb119]|uniref:hypothetical protein n=1 Tax=Micrococcaceae TaxID=1268 RepID=UPI000CFAAC25|nr:MULTISPECIES: hypothetical protein [unclassified Arthrobacter]MCS3491484.1 putative membrane protein [Arthrobacter sp. JUb119]PQZ89220.1 hypothetical protein CQ016_03670 [Arthrobacter sp. MYb222]PRB78530.1 hypothetical protein CQ012_03970 [Arthrobacter sp. MYb214]TDU25414.1 hypothetical protein EDF61_106152 [Arthrobacter sp. JUb115]